MLQLGMEEKAREFREQGSEIYVAELGGTRDQEPFPSARSAGATRMWHLFIVLVIAHAPADACLAYGSAYTTMRFVCAGAGQLAEWSPAATATYCLPFTA